MRIVIGKRFSGEDTTHLHTRIAALGGTVVSTLDPRVSIVIVPDDPPLGPEVQRAKTLVSRGASVEVLAAKAFAERYAPSAEELLALLRGKSEGLTALKQLLTHSWRLPDFPMPSLGGADLRGLTLATARLDTFELRDADLRDADLKDVHLQELSGCDLRGASLENASVSVLQRCDLRGANLRRFHARSVTGCDLREAEVNGMHLSYSTLSNCNLSGVDLTQADLRETNMPGSNLTGATLKKVELPAVNLSGADLSGADLSGAMLTKVNLATANLTKANLAKANLGGADLTDATLDGADFTGANLAGARVNGRGHAGVIGLAEALASVGGEVGPRLRELQTIAKAAASIRTKVEFSLPEGGVATVDIDSKTGGWRHTRVQTRYRQRGEYGYAESLVAALQDTANRWGKGTLNIDSITARSSKSPVGGKELRHLVVQAWCEVCGVEPPAGPEPKKGKPTKAQRMRELSAALLDELRSGPEGVERWNARSHPAWATLGADASFSRSELTGAKLDGIEIAGLDFSLSTFDGASLEGARVSDAKLDQASFVGASLKNATITKTTMTGADLTGARLADATLRDCDLGGDSKLTQADFTGAKLPGVKIVSDAVDGVVLTKVDLSGTDLSGVRLRGGKFSGTFDDHTRFPPSYKPPAGLEGPRDAKGMPVVAADVTLDLGDFFSRLKVTVGTSAYNKGKSMLKRSRYQLFSEVTDDRMVAIVKSQSDPSRLYACILGDETYSCITHRLNRCGGLGRGPCKHMMVMIMGLAQAGAVDPAKVDAWVQNSTKTGSSFDKDAAAEVFLRYKGAEAGEIDWRPTETVPEDFYAF